MSILQRVALPVANEPDAERTCEALEPYLGAVESVVAIHVIEKAGGAPDKAPVAKREADASSVVFLAREGGRFVRLLSGDTSMRLVTEGTLPVVALPGGEGS